MLPEFFKGKTAMIPCLRMTRIECQNMIEGTNRFFKPFQFEKSSAFEKKGVAGVRVEVQCLIQCLDSFAEFPQIDEGPGFLIQGMEIMGILEDGPVEISDGIAVFLKIVKGKTLPDPGIGVPWFQLEGFIKGKNGFIEPIEVSI